MQNGRSLSKPLFSCFQSRNSNPWCPYRFLCNYCRLTLWNTCCILHSVAECYLSLMACIIKYSSISLCCCANSLAKQIYPLSISIFHAASLACKTSCGSYVTFIPGVFPRCKYYVSCLHLSCSFLVNSCSCAVCVFSSVDIRQQRWFSWFLRTTAPLCKS